MDITFPTLNPYVPRDMLDPDIGRTALDCPAELHLPAGPATGRPAVLVSQGLGGPKPVRELRYGEMLASAGYVTLVPNSFAARGVDGSGDTRRALSVTTAMMLADTFAGLRYLAGHPAVRPAAISIVGFSYGGMVSVLAAYEQMRRLFAPGEDLRFAGHVSYYGSSVPRLADPATTGAPVLMFLGGRDRNVSLERSRLIADDLRRGGSPVEVRQFDDAYHQWNGADIEKRFIRFSLLPCCIRVDRDGTMWDERRGRAIRGRASRLVFMARNVSPRGYTIQRDETATAEADRQLLSFLDAASGRRNGAQPASRATSA